MKYNRECIKQFIYFLLYFLYYKIYTKKLKTRKNNYERANKR